MSRPRTPVRCSAPSPRGLYGFSASTRKTLRRVSSLTPARRLSTRLTVEMLTPAASAISASPGTLSPPDLRVRHTLQDAGNILQDRPVRSGRVRPGTYSP